MRTEQAIRVAVLSASGLHKYKICGKLSIFSEMLMQVKVVQELFGTEDCTTNIIKPLLAIAPDCAVVSA